MGSRQQRRRDGSVANKPGRPDQPLRVGDRVKFVKRTALLRGWPYRRTGTVIAHPYAGVWLVRVDGHPHSKVAVTEALAAPLKLPGGKS